MLNLPSNDYLFSIGQLDAHSIFSKGLIAFLFLIMTLALYRTAIAWTRKHLTSNEARYSARKKIRLGSSILFLILLLSLLSSELRNLTVILGFAGAGIAFALQEVIVSAAGWVAILAGKFYSPGDRIQLGGIYGDVLDIGLLRTTIMECGQWVQADQYNGRIVRVANSFIFKEPVFNYSSEFPFLWDEISIPVKTSSDQHLAKKIINEAAHRVVGDYVLIAQKSWQGLPEKYRIEAANLEPQIYMSFDANWVSYNLRYVVDYRKRRVTKDLLFTAVLDGFVSHADGVQVAISSQEIIHASPRSS